MIIVKCEIFFNTSQIRYSYFSNNCILVKKLGVMFRIIAIVNERVSMSTQQQQQQKKI